MKNSILLFIISAIIFSCNNHKANIKNEKAEIMSSEEITIEGTAYNRKGGAIVESNSIHYWIDGMDSWEDKYLEKTVIVTGIIEKRNDNPVFLDTSEIKMQGIPVYSEEELESMQSRTWITNAEVKLKE